MKKKAIVIDDDKVFCELAREILLGMGLDVIVTNDSREGLLLAKGMDLIVLDIIMHDMDGWTVLKNLKSSAETANIPVLLCSQIPTIQAGREKGAADYLIKPFTVDNFSKKVQKALAHAG